MTRVRFAPQVLPTQLIPDEKEGKVLRVRMIQKEGVKVLCNPNTCTANPDAWAPAPQVLPTQLIPDEKEGKVLRVRMIQKEGVKFFNPAYLFDEGSTISWIPCGRKLTCSFPGIKFYYGPDTYFGEEVRSACPSAARSMQSTKYHGAQSCQSHLGGIVSPSQSRPGDAICAR